MSQTPSKTRPKYASPTIQECLCEITFKLDENQSADRVSNDFYNRVKNDYPFIENVPIDSYTFDINPQEELSSLQQERTEIKRFRHRDSKTLLQLSTERLVINCLPPYPGWEEFKKLILQSFQHLSDITGIEQVSRVNLRYINRIERTADEEKLSAWLKPTQYLPQALCDSSVALYFHLETLLSNEEVVAIHVMRSESQQNPFGAFMFDIQCISGIISAEITHFAERLESLHDKGSDVFFGAKTDRLERLLKGELN